VETINGSGKELRILACDRAKAVVSTLVPNLSGAIIVPDLSIAGTEHDLLSKLTSESWDVILLTYPPESYDCVTLLTKLRKLEIDTPALVLAVQIELEQAMQLVHAGAVDVVSSGRADLFSEAIRLCLQEKENRSKSRRADLVRQALFQLSEYVLTSQSLGVLYTNIHEIISQLMPARNFYICIYDPETDFVSFPFYVDEYDPPPPPQPTGKGLTAYVLRTGKPLLASPDEFNKLVEAGEVILDGAPSIDWLGVPLKYGEVTIGVLAVQSYTEGIRFTHKEQEILEFVSTQIAMTIHRKRAEEALSEESQLRKAIEDSIMAGIIATDLDGRQSYVNPAFCRMMGWDRQELIGASPPYAYWPEDQVDKLINYFQITTGQEALPSDFEVQFVRKNGKLLDVYLLVSPLYGDNGKPKGWLASVYDITSRKRSEDEIRKQKTRAEALARLAARLNTRLNLLKVLNVVCEETAKALRLPISLFMVYDPEGSSYQPFAGYGLTDLSLQDSAPFPASILQNISGVGERIYLIPDFKSSNLPEFKLFERIDARSVLLVQLQHDKQPLGMIVLINCERRIFTHEDYSLLENMADLASQSILNARLFSEIEQRLEQLHSLQDVDRAINSSLDLRTLLDILLDQVNKLLFADAADVRLFNNINQELVYSVGRGFRTNTPFNERFRLRSGIAKRLLMDRKSVYIGNLINQVSEDGFLTGITDQGFEAYYGVPLIARGNIVGILELLFRAQPKITPEFDELIAALAGQAAIAIDNASLLDQLRKFNENLITAYDSTLEVWARALDLRDQEIPGHTQRVVDLAIEFGRRIGLRGEELALIRRGSLLHDIGNFGVPEQILCKPGPLTESEWESIRKHPGYAYELLTPIVYLRPVLTIPYCHHERWDGSGYPRHLREREIPMEARLFSLVDVWDALTTDRPYRKAWEREAARTYIASQSGKQFDPDLVAEFLSLI
jgi:PAS domain S-box-containing protein